MADLRDVRTVFFQKGDWSLVEWQDGQLLILHRGEPVNGYHWPPTAMFKAVVAFQELSRHSSAPPRRASERAAAKP